MLETICVKHSKTGYVYLFMVLGSDVTGWNCVTSARIPIPRDLQALKCALSGKSTSA